MSRPVPGPRLRASSPTSVPAPVRLPADHVRRIFKGMVVAELEAGFLRYSRRERLMNYARQLHIPEFEASLLIAEAQYYATDIEPVRFDSPATWETAHRPEAWSLSMRLTFAAACAALLDLAFIWWMFWDH